MDTKPTEFNEILIRAVTPQLLLRARRALADSKIIVADLGAACAQLAACQQRCQRRAVASCTLTQPAAKNL